MDHLMGHLISNKPENKRPLKMYSYESKLLLTTARGGIPGTGIGGLVGKAGGTVEQISVK